MLQTKHAVTVWGGSGRAGDRAAGESLADVMSGEVTHIHAVGVATLTIRAKSFLFSPQHHFLHCRSAPEEGVASGRTVQEHHVCPT